VFSPYCPGGLEGNINWFIVLNLFFGCGGGLGHGVGMGENGIDLKSLAAKAEERHH
jgi:hypothetical protein